MMAPLGERDDETRRGASPRPPQIRIEHLRKRAAVYARQSTPEQERNNIGSKADQLGLVEVAQQWWDPSQVTLFDDLGLSGTSTANRPGYLDMLAQIRSGEIAAVFAQDVSRLTRIPRDGEEFLEAAMDAGILLFVEGQFFDLSDDNDTTAVMSLFVLRMKMSVAWMENKNNERRFIKGRIATAKQGRAVSRPPIGYICPSRGQWIKDSNLKVRQSVKLLFRLALEFRSVGAIVNYLREHQILFPKRVRRALRWGPIGRAQLYNILTHPAYRGDYVYQRSRKIPARRGQPRRTQKRPESEWIVVPDHHKSYISREDWDKLQSYLTARRPRGPRPAPGKGSALLQGLVVDGKCNRVMHTQHPSRQQHPSYRCHRLGAWEKTDHSLTCSATLVDDAVINMILTALNQNDLEREIATMQATRVDGQALEDRRAHELQEATDVVNGLRARLHATDPRNRLVSLDIENDLQEALRRRNELHDRFSRERAAAPPVVSEQQVDDLLRLLRNLRHLWDAPTTTDQDRKRVLRAVLTCVMVRSATRDAMELEVIWAGGLRQLLHVSRTPAYDGLVRELREQGLDVDRIAAELRARGLKGANGRPVSRQIVYNTLARLGMNPMADRIKALLLVRQMFIDNVPRSEMLLRLNAEQPTRLGPWTFARLDGALTSLRRGVPGVPPLPAVLPFEREKKLAMDLILRRRAEGQSYKAIAADLNARGLRPQRAKEFTATQVTDLLHALRRRQAKYGHAGDGLKPSSSQTRMGNRSGAHPTVA
jgi:DNA invertase Pin-like site-specific DNA recombinase